MAYVSLGRDSSSLRDDGTFVKDENFDRRDPRQGKPLTWAEIRERLKNERETDEA